MKWILWLLKGWWLVPGGLLCAVLMLAGCEGGGDSHLSDGHDFGPNNPNLYVAFGDSITAGSGLASPSDCYSVKLAGMLNNTVINKGFPGYSSGDGLDVIYPILDDYQPGYMLILFGVNDIIMSYGAEVAVVNLRIMIQACQDNKTIPVIATLTPVFGEHISFSSGVNRLNGMIHQLCSELDVALVDLNSAFDDNPIYIQSDGLHPNETGHALMAITFYDVVK